MNRYPFKIFGRSEKDYWRDRSGFEVPSLRISLTSGCNENCFYCHNEGVPKKMTSVIQTGDIINNIYMLREYGLKKIKFTGGEPLLFKDLKNLLYKIRHIADADIFITTNGTLVRKRMKDLSPNIINKISVSLDTLNPDIYKFITGKNLLGEVLSGLNMLKKNGYNIEIDNLLLKGLNTDKKCLNDIIGYCSENGFSLQFIELSDKTESGIYRNYYGDPVKILQKSGMDFNSLKSNDRQFFKINGAKITLCRNVKDPCESSGGRCSGLRLLPNGFLKNFLYE